MNCVMVINVREVEEELVVDVVADDKSVVAVDEKDLTHLFLNYYVLMMMVVVVVVE